MCLSFSLEPTELEAFLTTHNVSGVTCERLQKEIILTLSDLKQMTDMDISRPNIRGANPTKETFQEGAGVIGH